MLSLKAQKDPCFDLMLILVNLQIFFELFMKKLIKILKRLRKV